MNNARIMSKGVRYFEISVYEWIANLEMWLNYGRDQVSTDVERAWKTADVMMHEAVINNKGHVYGDGTHREKIPINEWVRDL